MAESLTPSKPRERALTKPETKTRLAALTAPVTVPPSAARPACAIRLSRAGGHEGQTGTVRNRALGDCGISRSGVAATGGRAAPQDRANKAPRDRRGPGRPAQAAARVTRLRQLGRALHDVVARHGAAHDDERGPRLRSAR